MYDALVNIFQLIIDNIMNPIRDALNTKRIIQPIIDAIKSLFIKPAKLLLSFHNLEILLNLILT